MKIEMRIKRFILLPLFVVGVFATAFADGTKGDPEVDYKYQFSADFQIKLAKGLKLNLEPEFRFNDGFDKLLLSGGLTYKTFGCIYWGATYRLIVDRYENGTTTSMMGSSAINYDSESFHRYAFDVTYKDKFGRFTPSFRLRYNNFADDEVDDKEYLRYRAKVEYDIRKSKVTPFVAVEAYQEMADNMLHKMRYSTGFDLKVSKSSAFAFEYKFDLFIREYKNANIFSVGYKYKL